MQAPMMGRTLEVLIADSREMRLECVPDREYGHRLMHGPEPAILPKAMQASNCGLSLVVHPFGKMLSEPVRAEPSYFSLCPSLVRGNRR